MKVVYWSLMHGQAGTTSNMLANALIAGIQYKKKCLLMHTHFKFNNLEAPIVGCNTKNADTGGFFLDVGLDSLIRSFKAAKLSEEDLNNCCISIPNTNISLLPGTCKTNEASFAYEMDMVIINLLRAMEELVDIIFIDVCSGNHPLSRKIMEDADIIVVNLSQNIGILEACFSKEHNQILSLDSQKRKQQKLFYLIGNYDDNSKYNISNIRRRYHKVMKYGNSGIIPYNTAFHDALCDGKAIDFIKENLGCGKVDENYYFITEIRQASAKICKLAGMDIGKEGRKNQDELFT